MAAAVVVMLGWAVPAGAATPQYPNPYSAGSQGYDVSWPNCGEPLPTPSTFAIVGLGDGRAFTTSSCFATEWTVATKLGGTPAPALYFNTGYSGAYGRDITAAACPTSAMPKLTGVPKHDVRTYTKAWQIGCSEAAYAKAAAAANGATSPSMWWADIETGNSWSTNHTVNQYAVDGIVYEMHHNFNGPVGVYSNAGSWTKLVGSGFTPTQLTPTTAPITGDWGPGLVCTITHTTGFSGGPVWVVQRTTSTPLTSNPTGVDWDKGC